MNVPQVKEKSYEDQLASKIRALSGKRLILSYQQDNVAKLTVQVSTLQKGITTTLIEIDVLELREAICESKLQRERLATKM